MCRLIHLLHKDHINFSSVLTYLENQLVQLEKCEDENLDVVLDAIRYMKEYPDYYHHPTEDFIFEFLVETYKVSKKFISLLQQDHIEMRQLTDKLLEMMENTLFNVPQDRNKPL